MSYQCPKCKSEKYTDSWHKLGRVRTCECGANEVVVRPTEVRNSEPGEGRPRMSKKERLRWRAFVNEHFPEDDLVKALTR